VKHGRELYDSTKEEKQRQIDSRISKKETRSKRRPEIEKRHERRVAKYQPRWCSM